MVCTIPALLLLLSIGAECVWGDGPPRPRSRFRSVRHTALRKRADTDPPGHNPSMNPHDLGIDDHEFDAALQHLGGGSGMSPYQAHDHDAYTGNLSYDDAAFDAALREAAGPAPFPNPNPHSPQQPHVPDAHPLAGHNVHNAYGQLQAHEYYSDLDQYQPHLQVAHPQAVQPQAHQAYAHPLAGHDAHNAYRQLQAHKYYTNLDQYHELQEYNNDHNTHGQQFDHYVPHDPNHSQVLASYDPNHDPYLRDHLQSQAQFNQHDYAVQPHPRVAHPQAVQPQAHQAYGPAGAVNVGPQHPGVPPLNHYPDSAHLVIHGSGPQDPQRQPHEQQGHHDPAQLQIYCQQGSPPQPQQQQQQHPGLQAHLPAHLDPHQAHAHAQQQHGAAQPGGELQLSHPQKATPPHEGPVRVPGHPLCWLEDANHDPLALAYCERCLCGWRKTAVGGGIMDCKASQRNLQDGLLAHILGSLAWWQQQEKKIQEEYKLVETPSRSSWGQPQTITWFCRGLAKGPRRVSCSCDQKLIDAGLALEHAAKLEGAARQAREARAASAAGGELEDGVQYPPKCQPGNANRHEPTAINFCQTWCRCSAVGKCYSSIIRCEPNTLKHIPEWKETQKRYKQQVMSLRKTYPAIGDDHAAVRAFCQGLGAGSGVVVCKCQKNPDGLGQGGGGAAQSQVAEEKGSQSSHKLADLNAKKRNGLDVGAAAEGQREAKRLKTVEVVYPVGDPRFALTKPMCRSGSEKAKTECQDGCDCETQRCTNSRILQKTFKVARGQETAFCLGPHANPRGAIVECTCDFGLYAKWGQDERLAAAGAKPPPPQQPASPGGDDDTKGKGKATAATSGKGSDKGKGKGKSKLN